MSKFAVIRPPSTQEDEGRSFLIGVYPTLKAAEEVKEQEDGYYTHEIFEIMDDDQSPQWLGTLIFNSRKAGANQVITKVFRSEDPVEEVYRLLCSAAVRHKKHGGAIFVKGFYFQEIPR